MRGKMLPLLDLDIGCALEFEKRKNATLLRGDQAVLNPFAYATRESVLQALGKLANLQPRDMKLPRRLTQEEADFATFVILDEPRDPEMQVEIVKNSATHSLERVVVVPRANAASIWIVVDAWHLSRVSREGNDVEARVLLLPAPYQDLVRTVYSNLARMTL